MDEQAVCVFTFPTVYPMPLSQVPLVAVDSFFYGKLVVAPLNILLYNVFTPHGPDLYGNIHGHTPFFLLCGKWSAIINRILRVIRFPRMFWKLWSFVLSSCFMHACLAITYRLSGWWSKVILNENRNILKPHCYYWTLDCRPSSTLIISNPSEVSYKVGNRPNNYTTFGLVSPLSLFKVLSVITNSMTIRSVVVQF